VGLLLESGAQVNEQDGHGDKRLNGARAKLAGADRYCKLLLEKGADVKLRDREGATALMLAADKGRPTWPGCSSNTGRRLTKEISSDAQPCSWRRGRTS